jgi:hypothetical protein
MSYAQALDELRRRVGVPFARGSSAEAEAIARFRAFFASFAPGKVERLLDVTYAADVYFSLS